MLRNKVGEEEHLDIYGGLREDIGIKTYLHRPMDTRKKMKLRFRVGNLDLPEKTKEIYQKSGGGGRGYTFVPVWHSNKE